MSCLECMYFFTVRLGLNMRLNRDEADVSGGLFDNAQIEDSGKTIFEIMSGGQNLSYTRLEWQMVSRNNLRMCNFAFTLKIVFS